MGLIYLSWGISSIISASIVDKIGFRYSLVGGCLANAFLILCCLLTIIKFDNELYISYNFVYSAVIGSSIVNGAMTGPMWIAICNIITICSTKLNMGFHFSYFFVFYISSSIIGSLISSLVLRNFEQTYFFLIMAFISILSALYFFILTYPSPLISESNSEEALIRD